MVSFFTEARRSGFTGVGNSPIVNEYRLRLSNRYPVSVLSGKAGAAPYHQRTLLPSPQLLLDWALQKFRREQIEALG